jgi:hypothetical protein
MCPKYYVTRISFISICAALCSIYCSCTYIDFPTTAVAAGKDTSVAVSITKWYNDHKGAISLTSDDSFDSDAQKEARKFLLQYGMTMDYEVLTSEWEKDMNAVNYFVDSLIPSGTGYYGHGHLHINHDALSYEADLADFRKCYEVMKSFGMIPVSYAYPGGFGYHIATQNALHDAGFLSARMFEKLSALNPYIVPGNEKEPKDWYTLPALIMESSDYDGCVVCVNNTSKLIPYLDECINETAWIILTYHALNNTSDFGYYFLPDLKNDAVAISQRDFWQSSMSRVTLYIKEREQASAVVNWHRNEYNSVDTIKVSLDDNLPDSIYYQPLTLKFQLPSNWATKKISVIRDGITLSQFTSSSTEAIISLLPTKSSYYLLLDK